jgi:hypothetical protein
VGAGGGEGRRQIIDLNPKTSFQNMGFSMITIELENTFRAALAEGINLFLGAGFSLFAMDKKNRPMPLGSQLAQELIGEFNLAELTGLSLPQITTILESEKKDDFYKYLRGRFSVIQFDSNYEALDSLLIKTIFTTNIDNLVYKIFEKSLQNYINDVTLKGPAFKERNAIDYVPLHGSVVHESGQFIFNSMDIASSFQIDVDRWNYLIDRIQRFPTLFWGYSLEDSGVLQSLKLSSVKGKSHQPKWIMLQNENESNVKYFRALGFNIIVGNTIELLVYLRDLALDSKPKTVKVSNDTRNLFPSESVPPLGSVPVRPIFDFYLGFAPVWYDIFSGRIHKTSHYFKILESINSKKHTIVLGIPGCGKTTLMMQLASELNYNGHKLVIQSLSKEKASFLLKRLDDEKALIFIDNISDDIEAVELLKNASNVLLVGFERDYNYEVISHLVDQQNTNTLEVTELSPQDIQQIYSRIPVEIRNNTFVEPQTGPGVVPSILEVIELNINNPNIRERFHKVLNQLYQKSLEMHDLFVMICYVHSCRTPVSFDMAYSYLRKSIINWTEVYEITDNLGKLIAEYTDNFVDDGQDYFSPRSTVVAEAVISQVPSNDLKRVITTFHREVSSFRIAKYDIFKRRAFDANTMFKAFTDWKEGKEFYEYVISRDSSPYLYQQGALYLAKKKRFTEAFSWIDEAILQSNNKILSIRNSHAIILFRTNIIKDEKDPQVRSTLDESMKILAECYTDDKRKTYHALSYADQALQYSNKFRDEIARQYLELSKKWLGDEKKKVPWNRKINFLLKEVNETLTTYKK